MPPKGNDEHQGPKRQAYFHCSLVKVIITHQLERKGIYWEAFISHHDFKSSSSMLFKIIPSSSLTPSHTPSSPSTHYVSPSSHESSSQAKTSSIDKSEQEERNKSEDEINDDKKKNNDDRGSSQEDSKNSKEGGNPQEENENSDSDEGNPQGDVKTVMKKAAISKKIMVREVVR